MARNAAPPSLPTQGRAPRPERRGVGSALLLLLLAPVVSGCETLERMDYWDRFFEPTPRLAAPVVMMEPVRNPIASLPPAPAADWNPQPAAPVPSVVAMEPVESPEDRWQTPAANRSPQQGAAAARAAEARPDAAGMDGEARTRLLVRQNPWLTRFWMELTPAQRARVERQLHRGGDVRLASEQRPAAEPAAVWDPMGLSDRANLVFGRGASAGRRVPAGDRGAPAAADDS